MEPTVFAALDLYLSTAPFGELLTYTVCAIIAVGLGPFAVVEAVVHVAAARSEVL